jgi:hypothetical protein
MKTMTKLTAGLVLFLLLLPTTACGLLGSAEDEGTSSQAGLTNVSAVPCALSGGSCRAAQDCGRGSGSIGTTRFSCGGSRRVCCFAQCGAEKENVECCNASHTYAPRPLCLDGALHCAAGETKVPVGTCVAASNDP